MSNKQKRKIRRDEAGFCDFDRMFARKHKPVLYKQPQNREKLYDCLSQTEDNTRKYIDCTAFKGFSFQSSEETAIASWFYLPETKSVH